MRTPSAQAELSDKEKILRKRYLKDVARDVEGRLRRSLHYARFLDLGIEVSSNALKPPWFFEDPNNTTQYASISEAFEGCDQRLLVLGHPGAGKTTVLLHIAAELIRKAEASSDAPVPILVNLSKFRLPGRAGGAPVNLPRPALGAGGKETSDRAFEDWLASEMANLSGLDRGTARQWLRDGRLAALLDGLDEFNDERRVELAETLNATFLRDHPTLPVVICSRIHEYAVVQSNTGSRLELRGAVQLQPLTDDQVIEYLKAANAEGLLEALPDDTGLQELSRTPLTLSMLVLAYGGKAPTRLVQSASLSESRFSLFETYVAQMLQRQARRAQGKAFDGLAANDVPVDTYRFRPASLDRWLGWLALSLSVRMRTTFSPRGLTGLLLLSNEPERQPMSFSVGHAVAGLVMIAALAGVAASLIPPTAAAVSTAILVILATWLVTPWAATVHSNWRSGIALVTLFVVTGLLLTLGILSRWIDTSLSGAVSVYMIVPTVMAVLFLIMLVILDETKKIFVPILVAAASAAAMIAALNAWPITIASLQARTGALADIVIAVPVWLMLGLGIGIIGIRVNDWSETLSTLGFAAAIALVGCLAAWAIEDTGWVLALVTLAVAAAAMTAAATVRLGVMYVAAVSPFAVAGAVLAGPVGAVAGALVGGLAIALAERFLEDRLYESLSEKAERTFAWLDWIALSRIAWALLAMCGRLPFRQKQFLDYTVDAFLLKKSGTEFEFIHRLLRDYFALRELRPRLTSDNVNRIETIRSLGYQGEAALDMLVEFVEQGDESIRAAALSALGHIASPVSVARIEASASDRDPQVRDAVIRTLPRLATSAWQQILDSMAPISDGSEIPAILAAFPLDRRARFRTEAVHWEIRSFVKRMGQVAVQPLIAGLKNSSPESRAYAARLLAEFPGEAAVTALSAQIRDRDVRVRMAIADSLATIGDVEVMQPLEFLVRDRDKRVSSIAREALAKLYLDVFSSRDGIGKGR